MAGFNITDLQKLGEDTDGQGPGVLDPFASLTVTAKGKPGWLTQIEVTDVWYSTDAGKKPVALQPAKGFDRKMHVVVIEHKTTLTDAEALRTIEHPDDEPLPSRTGMTFLYLFPAETARAWTPEEKEALADKVKRAEGFLSAMYSEASMPLQAFDGKGTATVPASLAAMVKGRKGPLGKVIDGDWSEVKGMVFAGEITRREYQGKDYYDEKITGMCPPNEVGEVQSRDDA